jgi:hypothetical protein
MSPHCFRRIAMTTLFLFLLAPCGCSKPKEGVQETRKEARVGELDNGRYDPGGEIPPLVVEKERPYDEEQAERERTQIKVMMPSPFFSATAAELLVKIVDRKDAQKKAEKKWSFWDWIKYLAF